MANRTLLIKTSEFLQAKLDERDRQREQETKAWEASRPIFKIQFTLCEGRVVYTWAVGGVELDLLLRQLTTTFKLKTKEELELVKVTVIPELPRSYDASFFAI